MADIFDNARRYPVMYKIGSFPDGKPKFARAPFVVLKIQGNPTAPHETYICTSYPMAENPGLAMGQDDAEAAMMDRDGFGWIEDVIYTEEHLMGTTTEDTLFSQHRFGPL